MKSFMDEDFLLTTDTAKQLYHEYAEKLPIIDYHCHIIPEEIADDIRFENITKLWLGGDHYKWRLMRANGIAERYITGDASDRDKFQKWIYTLENAIGNPLYHWSHMELKRYFDYDKALNIDTAEEVWNLCNEKLKRPQMSARNIIFNSNVKLICTTDDPIDSLKYHKKLAQDNTFKVTTLPAFRPDEVVNINKSGYLDYIDKLSKASNISINNFTSLCRALSDRIEYFNSFGCRISDHGLEYVMYYPASDNELDIIIHKRLNGDKLTKVQELQYKTEILLYLCRQYHRYNWVLQLHYGVKRDNNSRFYNDLGPNTGFDCIDYTYTSESQLTDFLNALDVTYQLPKTVLYSINPSENTVIDTILGCFCDSSSVQKIQHGSAWWFNDHKSGMISHITSLASTSLLSNFIGMLTDSRSFLSYTRHEYFRRILCDLVGKWVENGEYPKDINRLGKIIQDISYYNCRNYFGFDC